MALISPSHHSTTQTGVAEQWVGEKTIPGRCGLWLFLGVGWCGRFVVVVWWCCVLLLLFVVGVVLGWCGVVWCWGGVVVWCIGAKWSPPPCGQYTRPSQSIWYPLCNVLLHSYCLHRSVQRLAQLEALQALTTLRLLADHIQDQVNQFGTGLPKDEVV
jgi:hypothetical protein